MSTIEARVQVLEELLQIALARTSGARGTASSAALFQPTWHVNRQTGVDTADGKTPATALNRAAEIVRRWASATPTVFQRIVLPAIAITITWDAGALVQPDIVDPRGASTPRPVGTPERPTGRPPATPGPYSTLR